MGPRSTDLNFSSDKNLSPKISKLMLDCLMIGHKGLTNTSAAHGDSRQCNGLNNEKTIILKYHDLIQSYKIANNFLFANYFAVDIFNSITWTHKFEMLLALIFITESGKNSRSKIKAGLIVNLKCSMSYSLALIKYWLVVPQTEFNQGNGHTRS